MSLDPSRIASLRQQALSEYQSGADCQGGGLPTHAQAHFLYAAELQIELITLLNGATLPEMPTILRDAAVYSLHAGRLQESLALIDRALTLSPEETLRRELLENRQEIQRRIFPTSF